MSLEHQLESLLFHFAEPKSAAELSAMLKVPAAEVREAAGKLSTALEGRGIRLMIANDEYSLVTSPESSETLERITKEEREKELGKAALETLSIVLYHGPLTRSSIDHIRGVNSNFIVRNLLIRGLIEKVPNPDDQRSFLYRPTMDLLRFLGVAKVEDLPDFAAVKAQIESFMTAPLPEEETKEEPVIQAEDSAGSPTTAP